MDHSQWTGRPPLHASRSSSAFSRISSISDITDLDSYEDDYRSPQSPPLTARASLVSLQSSDGAAHPTASPLPRHPPSGGAGWSVPFTGYPHGDGYEAIGPSNEQAPARQRRSVFGHGTSLRRAHETIAEEDSIDLALLRDPAPISTADPVPLDGEPVFDLTTSLGPMMRQDAVFVQKLQEQEASGRLTGGLGLGIRTDMVMSESQLLAASPVTDRGVSESLSTSLARRRSHLGRSATVRQLGQNEANKRGEVIEVIMEEGSDVDLSAVTGPNNPVTDNGAPLRRSTFPAVKASATQVFYPQPDWKPFSMRWPYLAFLIVLSLGLAGIMEVVFQMSTRQPLLAFHSPSDIPAGQYFAFKYVPTIVTVTFGVLWQITDFEVKRLEAFYQLGRENGALADESINVDYITNFNLLRPVRAMQCRHYAVAVSSVASLLAVSLVPTLGTACLVLTPDRDQRQADPLGAKFIEVQPVLSRLLSATLVAIAGLGCVLFYQLQSRRSGLVGDVKGIAGLASMAVVSHILMDFKDMDLAKHREIHNKLKGHRYVLRNASLAPDDQRPASKRDRDKYTKHHLSENPHPLMLRPAGSLPFIVAIGLFLALIPVCLFTPATLLTDKAPWVVTAVAVCIKLGWGSLETDVRMMEPFYILSRRHAPPRTLALDYTAIPFGWVAIEALLNGHFLVFFVGFGTVMTEILTVLVTSLAAVEGRDFVAPSLPAPPNSSIADSTGGDMQGIESGQETALSFWVSLGLATAILTYMAVVASVVFSRRHHPFLPRQPNTIASILAFIHQSKMLYDFVGTAKFTNAGMIRKVDGIGKTYGLGWFKGRDGQTHCGVDEEELLSSYKHGEDYSLSNMPWLERQTEWL